MSKLNPMAIDYIRKMKVPPKAIKSLEAESKTGDMWRYFIPHARL
jgi:hypothetical protein